MSSCFCFDRFKVLLVTLIGFLAPFSISAEDAARKIYFHNNVNWDNIQVRITGVSPVITGRMQSFLNSSIFEFSFSAPEDASLNCSFYTLVDGSPSDMTAAFPLTDGHVYTVSGDKGPRDEYDPNSRLPEKEYWLEPAMPSAREKATIFFNRKYNPDGPLADSDDIYIYTGLIKQGDPDSRWTGAPSGWYDLPDKYKMQQSSEYPDLFYLEFEPSIVEWFNVNSEDSYSRLALIFRDYNGRKQHNTDQFINLRVTAPAGEGLGAALSYSLSDNDGTADITCENGHIFLTPWGKNIIKVFTLRNDATASAPRESISVVDDQTREGYGFNDILFNVTENSDYFFFKIPGGISAHVEKETSLISFFNPGVTEPALVELGGLVNKPGNVSVSFNGMSDRGFYGGGYQGNIIDWNGRTMVMNNNQQGNWGQGDPLCRNIGVPFFVSTEGYGVYFDDHYRNASISPSEFGSTYSSRSTDPVAYYFIGGGDMESVMQNYTMLTGLQELPPYWALGYITSKFSFATRQEAERTVANTRNVNIPVDGIVFDIHWQTGNYGTGTSAMGRIDWERSSFPNPEEMLAGLRHDNVHAIAITEPYFTTQSGNYDYLSNNGYFADNHVSGMEWLQCGDGVGLLDITNQGAIDWFKNLYIARTLEGIDSWWLDLGEPERHDSDSRYVGGSIEQIHNEYGLRWNALAFDAIREAKPDMRFITMPRAGTSGMQRYNAFPWTGDIARSWAGLRAQVPALVSAAMSGISYMGSDIGGFIADGRTDADLYRRWVQLGVFYPSMRTHSATEPEVWRPAYDRVRDDVRDAINLRYAYLPYTYTQSYLYSRFGTPIARPANFADENKSRLRNEIGAYYWGPDMYVAPVLANTTVKEVNFPEGDWLDMTDFSTIYPGASSIQYNAPVNVIPRFMRRGAFITRYAQDTFTSTAEINENALFIDHFAPLEDHETEGSILFSDDHQDVNSIAERRYIVTRMSSKNSEGALTVYFDTEGEGWENMAETRDILLRIHDFNITENNGALTPGSLRLTTTYNSQPDSPERAASSQQFTQTSGNDELLAADGPAYYHDVNAHKIHVRIPEAETRAGYKLDLGDFVVTGVDNVLSSDALALSYGNRFITYSAPASTADLTLEIITPTGITAACFNNLNADGYAAQIPLELTSGLYIARLTARDSSGFTATRSLKFRF